MSGHDHLHELAKGARRVDPEWAGWAVIVMHPDAYYEIARDVAHPFDQIAAPHQIFSYPVKVSADEPADAPPRYEVRMPIDEFRRVYDRGRLTAAMFPPPAPVPTLRAVAAKWWGRARGRGKI